MNPLSGRPFARLAAVSAMCLAFLAAIGCSEENDFTCHAMATGQQSIVNTYHGTDIERVEKRCEEEYPGRTCSCSVSDSNPVSGD